MRKLTITLLAATVAMGALAAPAVAKKKKVHIHEEFSAQLLPFPNAVEDVGHSCTAGLDDVHKFTIPFQAPVAGTLTVELAGFTGDWDLYVFDEAGGPLGASEESQLQGSEAKEQIVTTLKAKETINIVACNWLGAPDASGYYKFIGS